MEEFDPKSAIGALSKLVGQALAVLAVDDPGKGDALDRMLIRHEAIAKNQSQSYAMNELRDGFEKMHRAISDGLVHRQNQGLE